MQFRWVILLLVLALYPNSRVCLAETALFNAFFEQRELVAAVKFVRGSSQLDQAAMRLLEAALPRIKGPGCEARLIRIEGFSGREGANEAAFRLSMNRAYAVAKFLETKGIPCLVGVTGYGNLRAGQGDSPNEMRVEIAAYPKMFLFDFESARYVDLSEVKSHD